MKQKNFLVAAVIFVGLFSVSLQVTAQSALAENEKQVANYSDLQKNISNPIPTKVRLQAVLQEFINQAFKDDSGIFERDDVAFVNLLDFQDDGKFAGFMMHKANPKTGYGDTYIQLASDESLILRQRTQRGVINGRAVTMVAQFKVLPLSATTVLRSTSTNNVFEVDRPIGGKAYLVVR